MFKRLRRKQILSNGYYIKIWLTNITSKKGAIKKLIFIVGNRLLPNSLRPHIIVM